MKTTNKYCIACGKEMKKDQKFCEFCGTEGPKVSHVAPEGNQDKSRKTYMKNNLWGLFLGFPIAFLIIGVLNANSEFGIGGLYTIIIMISCFHGANYLGKRMFNLKQ